VQQAAMTEDSRPREICGELDEIELRYSAQKFCAPAVRFLSLSEKQ